MSIVISPLTRIHNETGLPIKLRFRRAQQKEDEFASEVLNAGDTVDDSMAMFDAINLSGGEKKALMSLAVGMRNLSQHHFFQLIHNLNFY